MPFFINNPFEKLWYEASNLDWRHVLTNIFLYNLQLTIICNKTIVNLIRPYLHLCRCKNMKNKKYHTVWTLPKSNRKITESKIDTSNINAWPLTFMAWYRHINESGGVRLDLWTQVSYFSEMIAMLRFRTQQNY